MECVEKSFGHKFRMIANTIRYRLDEGLASETAELTGVQCATMHYILMNEGKCVLQKDIETAFSISGATATNILKRLEAQELVERIPMEKDARMKRISLTEKGRGTCERARARIRQTEALITEGMTEEEKAIFSELLDRALQNLGGEL